MKNEPTWPPVIYLQHGCKDVPGFDRALKENVTWEEENIHGNDVKYIRAKGSRTNSAREAEREKMTGALKALRLNVTENLACNHPWDADGDQLNENECGDIDDCQLHYVCSIIDSALSPTIQSET